MNVGPMPVTVFKDSVEHTIGTSVHVIIIFADIRAFSAFSRSRDATEVGAYVRRVYLSLVEVFGDAEFVKATGDGLLIVLPCESSNVASVLSSAVARCLDLDASFAGITREDPMVNFEVPEFIGFGIARGTACRLDSSGSILDYSGHRLNLAARLVGLARPHGVVIDGEAGIDLVTPELRDRFDAKNVYIRGIADTVSRSIFVQRDAVILSRTSQLPTVDEPWETQTRDMDAKAIRSFVPSFREDIERRSLPGSIIVQFMFGSYENGQHAGTGIHFRCNTFRYSEVGNKQEVWIETAELIACLEENGVPDDGRVRLKIDYVPRFADR